MKQIIFTLLLGVAADAGVIQRHLHHFCETYLAAQDPQDFIDEAREMTDGELFGQLNFLNQRAFHHGNAKSWEELDNESAERGLMNAILKEIDRRGL